MTQPFFIVKYLKKPAHNRAHGLATNSKWPNTEYARWDFFFSRLSSTALLPAAAARAKFSQTEVVQGRVSAICDSLLKGSGG